jgi:hypothetical protein
LTDTPKTEPMSEVSKGRLLRYLRQELKEEERRNSQVCEPDPTYKPRHLTETEIATLRYLRRELIEEERRKSQIIDLPD